MKIQLSILIISMFMLASVAQELKIGWAARDITPDRPVAITGQHYLRVSKGVADPLILTALAVDNGEDCVIFLSLDMISIRALILDDIREKVAKLNPEIPVLKILANTTHTHTAANTYDAAQLKIPETTRDESGKELKLMTGTEYRNLLTSTAAEAIAEAWSKRTPGGVAWGYGYATTGHNRRAVYLDDLSKRPDNRAAINGHAAMYGNTNDPMFSHYEAGSDSFVNLLYTFDPAGKLTGAIINIACPSQCSEHSWYLSADFWHDIRAAVRKQFGDILILGQCAAAGDLSPRTLHYKKAQERRFALKYGTIAKDQGERKDIAERVTTAFAEVLSWARKDIRNSLPIKHAVETVKLSKRMVSDAELAEAKETLAKLEKENLPENLTEEQRLMASTRNTSTRKREERVIARYQEQKKDPFVKMELHAVKIGDIAFASNRFELYMDYMHRIQARSPFEQTFIVQLAGTPGVAGGSYLPTQRSVENRGYGSTLSSNQVSPQGGQELVDETVRILKEIYQK